VALTNKKPVMSSSQLVHGLGNIFKVCFEQKPRGFQLESTEDLYSEKQTLLLYQDKWKKGTMPNSSHFGQYFALKLLSKGVPPASPKASASTLESTHYGFLFHISLFST